MRMIHAGRAESHFINALATRMAIPLRREAAFCPPARDVNPVLGVDGEPVVLDAAALDAIPCTERQKPLTNLREHRAAIQDALDTLFGAH